MKLQSTQQPLFSASLKNIAKFATFSLVAGLFSMGLPVHAAESQPTITATISAKSTRQVATAPATLPNGVYLYGQSAQPEQVGRAYFVFEVKQGKVLGAFYMPRSSFDCAYGTFEAEQVALTVIDSYEKTRHPYAIALQKTANVATTGNPALTQISLEGFQPLKKLSATDQRILNVCKQNYPSALK
ncbi:hypothetical protein [Phormidesmis priestleyi]